MNQQICSIERMQYFYETDIKLNYLNYIYNSSYNITFSLLNIFNKNLNIIYKHYFLLIYNL